MLAGCIGGYGQEKKQATFIPPFDFPLTLSGNFGEIRSNHFHGGLDFKTGGVIGLNLLKLCFWYGMPYLLFAGDKNINLVETMAITALSVMLAAVIPAPAGIGSTEFVFTGLFAGIVGTGIAGSASLLYRFATFVFPFLIGVAVVITRKIRERRAMENL